MSIRVELLASGGMDSSMLAFHYVLTGHRPRLHFIDYGQRAARQERGSVARLAAVLDLEMIEHRLPALGDPTLGEVPGRNRAFVKAVSDLAKPPSIIGLGIHAGSPYEDTRPEFVASTQAALNRSHEGGVVLDCPFVDSSKVEILRYAAEVGVNLSSTYSCDSGENPACGRCRSCLERHEALSLLGGRVVGAAPELASKFARTDERVVLDGGVER